MAIDIGRIAYMKYVEALKDSSSFPDWSQIGKPAQDAWRHAAVAILNHVDEERKSLQDSDT